MTAEHRVYGPPGTGKTTYLSHQARNAAEKFTPSEVVIASLTRTAAQEIGGRDTGIPRKNVSTLHSHAYRSLDRPRVADVPDGFKEWNRWVGRGALQITAGLAYDPDQPPAEMYGYATDGEVKLAEMGVLRNRMLARELWPPSVREFAERWEAWKRETERMDFADMIEAALHDADTLPGAPSVFMLDEAQDLSALELALARKWGAETEHFVIVGDPDQNLYEWRGSDPAAFTAVDAASEHVLSQSYRVPRAVHSYAVEWIERVVGRPPIEYMPTEVEGEVEQVRVMWTHPEVLVDRLAEHAERGETAMVLASCGFMLNPLIAVLKDAGMPFHNPYRVKQGAWNPLRGASRLLAFMRPDEKVWGDEARLWTWDDLRLWTDPLQATSTLERGVKALIGRKCDEDQFGRTRADETPKAGSLFKLFREEARDPVYDMDLDWWESNLRASAKGRFNYPLEVARSRGGRALREEPKVILGTIHSVKGGEADVVYVFPDLSRRAAFEAWRTPAGKNAMYRLFYVAFTRARRKLCVCRPEGAWYANLPAP